MQQRNLRSGRTLVTVSRDWRETNAPWRNSDKVTLPVSEQRKVVSESRERTFDRDISYAGDLQAALETMARELCDSLDRHGRRGRTIAIKVRLDDFTTVTRARTLESPTRERELVTSEALRLLRDYDPPRPVRLLGVRVAGLEGDAPAPPPRKDQLALEL